MSQAFRVSMFLFALFAFSHAAHAQDSGARLTGFYAGTFGEGETNIAAGGSAGYRLTPHIGFDFEAFAIPDLEFDNTGDSGRGVAFLTNFVAEFPSRARWLTPYVQGGGGVANISQSRFSIADGRTPRASANDPRRDPRAPLGRFDNRGNPGGVPGANTIPALRGSETGVALTVGGGVDFTVWKGLAVGPNISYLKLFNNLTDRDLTRIGLRTSYRF